MMVTTGLRNVKSSIQSKSFQLNLISKTRSLDTSLESSVMVRFLPANAMAALAALSVIAALSMIRALKSVM